MRLMMSGGAAPLLGCSGCRDFGSLGDRECVDCGLLILKERTRQRAIGREMILIPLLLQGSLYLKLLL